MSKLKHELVPVTRWREWRVEAIDMEGEGLCYVTIFSGPGAEERAREYAEWKNGEGTPSG